MAPTSLPHGHHDDAAFGRDRILVLSSAGRTVDLLRLATIRSDDVLLVAETIDAAARRLAHRFAIETREGPVSEHDFDGISAALVSLGEDETENRLVRMAHRKRVAVHVVDRPLVSDFTILALLQQRPLTAFAA